MSYVCPEFECKNRDRCAGDPSYKIDSIINGKVTISDAVHGDMGGSGGDGVGPAGVP